MRTTRTRGRPPLIELAEMPAACPPAQPRWLLPSAACGGLDRLDQRSCGPSLRCSLGTRDGPDLVRERAGLPGRGARVAGGERAGRAAAVDGHCRGLGTPPGLGGEARRGSVVGGLMATGLPRPRGVAGRVGDLRGGVLPRRCTRPGLPERHLPARPDPLRPRHQGPAGPVPAEHGHRRADLGTVLVRARGRLRPGLAHLDRAS